MYNCFWTSKNIFGSQVLKLKNRQDYTQKLIIELKKILLKLNYTNTKIIKLVIVIGRNLEYTSHVFMQLKYVSLFFFTKFHMTWTHVTLLQWEQWVVKSNVLLGTWRWLLFQRIVFAGGRRGRHDVQCRMLWDADFRLIGFVERRNFEFGIDGSQN